MPEITLHKFEDTVKLSHGMAGKLAIEVKVSDETPEKAMSKAFEILKATKTRAAAEGYVV